MRFHTKLLLSGKAVARGYGPNKKEAQKAAARIFIELMYPAVYKTWLAMVGIPAEPFEPDFDAKFPRNTAESA